MSSRPCPASLRGKLPVCMTGQGDRDGKRISRGAQGIVAVKEFVSRFRIEWAHCDAAGIVFYPHYYVWFDQGTERLFSANGLSYGELAAGYGISGMPLLETGCQYRTPCRLGMAVELTSRLDEISGRTFLVQHVIRHDDGTEALHGFERRAMVVADPSTARGIRAVAFPDDARERFGFDRTAGAE